MKLIIQIPCLNEEETLAVTLNELPKQIDGIDEIDILIIDDGSTDNTVRVAKDNGVNHIIKFTNNKGLAEAFNAGIDACLKLGADIIVNTDGDNQYSANDIEKLILPILKKEADIVIGDRQVNNVQHFSFTKKKLQLLGSWVVKHVSNTEVPDATSGFRAFSKEAALRMNVITKFSYTLETIIQAGKKNLAVAHIPVQTNEKLRDSRLFKSIPSYLKRSVLTIFRIYTMYEPLKTFIWIGGLIFGAGFLVSLRYLFLKFIMDSGAGHIQSLILGAVLLMIGFQVMMIGLVADLIGGTRRLQEDILYRVKKLELSSNKNKKNVE
ncbi:glycosyltransferase family 2 protein [candidate division KSB1 bacterium]|nr:glycosyltransferase family 2 protein [candidate division KSB1 bacterium]MBL7095030.1 glycosyltransferase family 2 protein [candidate division KSB1 bacterium]